MVIPDSDVPASSSVMHTNCLFIVQGSGGGEGNKVYLFKDQRLIASRSTLGKFFFSKKLRAMSLCAAINHVEAGGTFGIILSMRFSANK